ncbi:MAG: lycopene cyclase domain-containing protein [Bacteroidales bacterium]|nr:lycopene cyclase domain-containing protein [Bacteroidales bacterium]
MKLYALLLFASGLVPLALSFDTKLQFYKQWKLVFPAIILTAVLFIIPDIYFTRYGIWGFNHHYLLGINIFDLPLEEVMFFIVIPYASLFIHYSFFHYFPNRYPGKSVLIYTLLFSLIAILAIVFYHNRDYTLYAAILTLTSLLLSYVFIRETLAKFLISFLIILMPFLIVNGILTGTLIDGEVVWYNSHDIIGFRIFTIPVEDFFYGFSLILLNLFFIESFRKAAKIKTNKV